MTEEYKSHPSYGTIGFYRTQGNPRKLFGSALPQHGHFIHLSIKRASIKHDLHQDWIYGHHQSELIDVWLSANQFAELITTMNVGDGVPCTIKRFNGETMPDVPDDEQTTAEKISTGFSQHLKNLDNRLRERTKEAMTQLRQKGTIKRDAREQIAKMLEWIHMEVSSNLPFTLEQFQRAVDDTSQHAKAELDAMVSHVVTKTGLQAITDGAPLVLKAHEEENEDNTEN